MSDSVVQPADLQLVRASYDRVADNYVALGVGDLAPAPWLRAALGAFAEDVRALGPVLDVGCGPGTVTAHLAGLGVDVSGVDLSPRMIAHARRLHPALRFAVGSATEIDLAEASLGGVLGWWSLFNLPRNVLPDVLTSFARALVPDGQLLLGMHVGDGDIKRTKVYGTPVPGRPISGSPRSWPFCFLRPASSRSLSYGCRRHLPTHRPLLSRLRWSLPLGGRAESVLSPTGLFDHRSHYVISRPSSFPCWDAHAVKDLAPWMRRFRGGRGSRRLPEQCADRRS